MGPNAELERLRAEVVAKIVAYLVASRGAIATPGDPVARVRRAVLHGLRGRGASAPDQASGK